MTTFTATFDNGRTNSKHTKRKGVNYNFAAYASFADSEGAEVYALPVCYSATRAGAEKGARKDIDFAAIVNQPGREADAEACGFNVLKGLTARVVTTSNVERSE